MTHSGVDPDPRIPINTPYMKKVSLFPSISIHFHRFPSISIYSRSVNQGTTGGPAVAGSSEDPSRVPQMIESEVLHLAESSRANIFTAVLKLVGEWKERAKEPWVSI